MRTRFILLLTAGIIAVFILDCTPLIARGGGRGGGGRAGGGRAGGGGSHVGGSFSRGSSNFSRGGSNSSSARDRVANDSPLFSDLGGSRPSGGRVPPSPARAESGGG